MSLETPSKIRTLQRKLYRKAKDEPDYRFYLLYDKVYREDILAHAYELAKARRGAPGVDGQTFEGVEAQGLEKWLTELRNELRTKRYKPQPVRRVMIPKPGGGERPRFGTGWCRPLPSWCWSRSSRQTWNPVLMVTDRSAALRTPSGKCMNSSARVTRTWWTRICRSTSRPFRTGN